MRDADLVGYADLCFPRGEVQCAVCYQTLRWTSHPGSPVHSLGLCHCLTVVWLRTLPADALGRISKHQLGPGF